MNIRPFQLPQDLDTMNTLIMEGFDYPDHPEWSIQADEKEGMLDRVRGMKRMWPIMQILRLFSPILRDAMRGFIAEENGKPIGLMNYMRQTKEPEWFLANATVLPPYRRKGIARQLLAAIQNDLRQRKAHTLVLGIIDQNVPSLGLCQSMGFEIFTSMVEMDLEADAVVPAPTLPAGWTLLPRSRFDWRTNFELAKRITPENVARYEPPVERRFRMPLLRPLFGILFEKAGGNSSKRFTLRAPDGKVMGLSGYWFRVNKGGVNDAGIDLDPAHPEMAPFLVAHAITTIQSLSPGRRIEFSFESWQPALIEAAESLGCKKRFGAHRLGMKLE
jgi:ribosomal protein S18 acetylase RimI-like enzyme